jgi:hypothetical protein
MPADELPGLSERQITLVTDVDGKLPVIRLQMTTANETDQWVIGNTLPWPEVTPASGTGAQKIILRVRPGASSPGNYEGIVPVRSPNLPDTTKFLKVTYTCMQPVVSRYMAETSKCLSLITRRCRMR